VGLNFEGLPAPWVLTDIGLTNNIGGAIESNGVYTVTGAGYLNNASDKFTFVSQPLMADGEINAQLTQRGSLSGTRAGLMIRESLAPGAKFVFLGFSANGSIYLLARTATNGKISNSASARTKSGDWLRLVRNGKYIRAYRSSDGATWSSVGSVSITMAANIQMGMAVTSGSTSATDTIIYNSPVAVP
jgi:regulation of enolase protein 1 (concanavalin A-like superfamily)